MKVNYKTHVKRHKYSFTILLTAILAGLISFMIFKGEMTFGMSSLHDRDFRDKGILFVLSTITVIFGIEYFQQKQKDELFLENLKIIGFGYNIHFSATYAYNLLVDLQIIDEPKIAEMYHTYFSSAKDLIKEQEVKKTNKILVQALLRKFSDIQIDAEHIEKDTQLSLILKSKAKFESQLQDMTSKLSFAINNESAYVVKIFKLIEGLKKVIWELEKLQDENSDKLLIRKKRLIMGILVIIDNCSQFYKSHESIFYESEYEYERMLLTKRTYQKWINIEF